MHLAMVQMYADLARIHPGKVSMHLVTGEHASGMVRMHIATLRMNLAIVWDASCHGADVC
jgi:hypothetical protein